MSPGLHRSRVYQYAIARSVSLQGYFQDTPPTRPLHISGFLARVLESEVSIINHFFMYYEAFYWVIYIVQLYNPQARPTLDRPSALGTFRRWQPPTGYSRAPCPPPVALLLFCPLQWPYMPKEWRGTLAASPWLKMFQNARKWCDEHPRD